jgi:hypothetical protein
MLVSYAVAFTNRNTTSMNQAALRSSIPPAASSPSM